MKQIRLISGFFTVGMWTMASRILRFLRDAMILAFLGTGPLYEAYVVAFRLPNMFRRFFAEGAFNAAFVPMFSKRLEGEENAEGFAQDAFNLLAAAVLALVGLAMVTPMDPAPEETVFAPSISTAVQSIVKSGIYSAP